MKINNKKEKEKASKIEGSNRKINRSTRTFKRRKRKGNEQDKANEYD